MWDIEKIISKGEYNYVIVRDHPKATKYGYVLEHRVVMENHLGRLLNANEVVHHKNGDRKDNRVENLEAMTKEEHASLHSSARGRLTVRFKCPWCKKTFTRHYANTHLGRNGTFTSCSRHCNGSFCRVIQLNGRTAEVERAISENVIEVFVLMP